MWVIYIEQYMYVCMYVHTLQFKRLVSVRFLIFVFQDFFKKFIVLKAAF